MNRVDESRVDETRNGWEEILQRMTDKSKRETKKRKTKKVGSNDEEVS